MLLIAGYAHVPPYGPSVSDPDQKTFRPTFARTWYEAAVDATQMRRAIARTPLAPVAAFPKRLARVARHDAKVLRISARWLVTSREHHNYTYELTKLSRHHLAWFVSVVCDIPVKQVRAYVAEIESDDVLRHHIERATATAARRGLADKQSTTPDAWGGTRSSAPPAPHTWWRPASTRGWAPASWRPPCSATRRRATRAGSRRWTSTPRPATWPPQPWSEVVDLVIGDSIASIGALDRPVDLFLHDSDHSRAHEKREFDAVEPKLAPGAHPAHRQRHQHQCARRARRAHRPAVPRLPGEPANHWYPGDGIGVAW